MPSLSQGRPPASLVRKTCPEDKRNASDVVPGALMASANLRPEAGWLLVTTSASHTCSQIPHLPVVQLPWCSRASRWLSAISSGVFLLTQAPRATDCCKVKHLSRVLELRNSPFSKKYHFTEWRFNISNCKQSLKRHHFFKREKIQRDFEVHSEAPPSWPGDRSLSPILPVLLTFIFNVKLYVDESPNCPFARPPRKPCPHARHVRSR